MEEYFQELDKSSSPNRLTRSARRGLRRAQAQYVICTGGFSNQSPKPTWRTTLVMRKGSSKGLSFPDSHTEHLSSIVDFAW